MDDALIIEMFKKQNESAIKEAEKKYGNLLMKIAVGVLYRKDEAEEIVNDTLLAAWNSIKDTPPENLCAYLCKIARNKALKKYRYNTAKKRNSEYTLSLEELGEIFPSEENPENTYTLNETKECITRFIKNLDTRDRKIFMRRYWYFDSVKDISQAFELSENYVKVILFRIRHDLKEYLKEEGNCV